MAHRFFSASYERIKISFCAPENASQKHRMSWVLLINPLIAAKKRRKWCEYKRWKSFWIEFSFTMTVAVDIFSKLEPLSLTLALCVCVCGTSMWNMCSHKLWRAWMRRCWWQCGGGDIAVTIAGTYKDCWPRRHTAPNYFILRLNG